MSVFILAIPLLLSFEINVSICLHAFKTSSCVKIFQWLFDIIHYKKYVNSKVNSLIDDFLC